MYECELKALWYLSVLLLRQKVLFHQTIFNCLVSVIIHSTYFNATFSHPIFERENYLKQRYAGLNRDIFTSPFLL
ncbi:MAG: hypothetical protein EAZ59_08745 [Oscillatoriales cyanobacterium]|nr:MAG: hypothetical protein EAZ59_08745 [Oscillatoriales cyanobacterium]